VNDCDAVPALAVRIAACDVDTVETVAVKPMLEVPAGTVTDAGTTTAVLLLPRLTLKPPPAAAAFNVTVHASVPAPLNELVVQVSPFRTGKPVPVRPTIADEPVEELLVSVN